MIVKLEYTGTFADGTVFDQSAEGEPLEFMYGAGMMIPGLETELAGLRKGDTKRIEVKAADAYGEHLEDLVQDIPREQIPADMELEVGTSLAAPDGSMYLTVLEIREESVLMDFNHPMAGKDLIFDIKVVDVHRPSVEEAAKYGSN